MKVMTHIPLRWRLLLVIAIPVIAIGGLTIYALNVFASINHGVSSIYNDRVVPLQELKSISDDYAVLVIDSVNKANAHLITPEAANKALGKAQSNIHKLWQQYTSTALTPRETKLVQEAEVLFAQADQAIQKARDVLASAAQTPGTDLDVIDGPLYRVIDPITAKIDELMTLQLNVAREERQSVGVLYDHSLVLYPSIAITVTILGLLLSWMIARSINQPIQAMQKAMRHITAESDLSLRIKTQGRDELAELGEDLNRMLTQFDGVITHLSAMSDEVSASAEELSSINCSAMDNVQTQTDQTDQVAAAINQMSATAVQAAQSAEEVRTAAQQARTLSNQGRDIGDQGRQALMNLANEIQNVAQQIDDLEKKSADISQVTQVINDIAEQTNLLALNAAIEAARAGEHGRGFAVVADEVRSLAQRTQSSVGEITQVVNTLIEGSHEAVTIMKGGLSRVEENQQMSHQVAQSLHEIGDGIDHIVRMIEQIASASEQQSAATEEINQSLSQIVNISEQTLMGTEQSTAASEELAQLATTMKTQVSVFKLSVA
ncbi:hypothetical protein BFW38_11540 [Terasakiispira papahanaumokuakeensis]|uniref:Chemotaxis protein n=1 Tax=Terasakiispira papahanaumokuakeensis TaxID=197479 RepID=A0A1E2VB39_9GAMM|nr:methyl-accepting chemotaxis protein [Terasakiispira papahanaumokuakeensis]ODC04072.1 hypothetical protein BFW38_11540 [Terasakiispira papahanaumokuakeensis]